MMIDSVTAARLLTALSACRRRNKDLSTKVVQLTQSRERWKRKATERQREISRLRPRTRPSPLEYGPDVVNRILQIPPRDIE